MSLVEKRFEIVHYYVEKGKKPKWDYCQGLETKGILINLRTHLGIEKAKDPVTVTPYL